MTFYSSEIFEEVLVTGFVACLLLTRGVIHFMKVAANRSLPEGKKLSFFRPRWNRVVENYRQVYPTGRAYGVLIGLVLCQATIGVVLVVSVAWQIFGHK